METDVTISVDTSQLDEALDTVGKLLDAVENPYIKKLLDKQENELNKFKMKHKKAGKYISRLIKQSDADNIEISRLLDVIVKDKREIRRLNPADSISDVFDRNSTGCGCNDRRR